MKILFLTLVTVCMSWTASAAVFNCGVPQNSEGQAIGNGLSYKVQYATDGQVYVLTEGKAAHRILLNQTYSLDHETKFAANGVAVEYMNRQMTLIVNDDFTATCALDSQAEQDDQSIGLACTNRFLADPFFHCEDIQP